MLRPEWSFDIDPGKFRSFQRATSTGGFFEVCALDHLDEFVALLGDKPSSIGFGQVVEVKAHLVRALGPHSSSVLLDARYGLQALLTGDVPRDTGIISALEAENYAFPDGPRGTRLRQGWDARKIAFAGGDMAKILWFYRPDLDLGVAERQRELLRAAQSECDDASLPLIVEPIWFAVQGEDPTSPGWQQGRTEGILRSAREANGIGADVLKVQFPGSLHSPADVQRAADACAELTATVTVPWVVLSAGVGYSEFTEQLEIACTAGASGYMAGRSVWKEAVTSDVVEREKGLDLARQRLDTLASITRKHGRAVAPAISVGEALAAMPDDWYLNWHDGTA